MQHINNSPNLLSPDVRTPLASMELPHPNVIAQLTPWQLDFRQITPGELQTRVRAYGGDDAASVGAVRKGQYINRAA